MLDHQVLRQNIRIHVYETASDLPSGWDNFVSGLVKALPWIGIALLGAAIIIGLIFLYKYIIENYRDTEKFWDRFIAVNTVLALGFIGFIYVNSAPIKVFFAQKEISITIVKDQDLVATVDNLLYVKTGWVNGHNVFAAAPPIERIIPPNSVYASERSRNSIRMSFELPNGVILDELPTEMAIIDANPSIQTGPDNYKIIIAVNDDAEAGDYEVDIDWETLQRDSIMSIATAQRLIDSSKDNKLVTDRYWIDEYGEWSDYSYYNAIGQYLDSDDIPTEDMYQMNCDDIETLRGYGYDDSSDEAKSRSKPTAQEQCGSNKYPKFHHWLNAPHPIYRENIKSIKFSDKRPSTTIVSDDKAGRYCWDISEHQSGQVIACAKRRGDIKVKVGDIAGLGIVGRGIAIGTQFVADAFNTLKCSAKWVLSWFGGEKCDEDEWNADQAVLFALPQLLYDIEIGQDGGVGVNAPVNSSSLFFYVGQNTDYFMDGRFMVPRVNSREWYDKINLVITSDDTGNIPVISFTIEALSRLADFLADAIENVGIQTKICSYTRYFAYGPKDKEDKNDCGESSANPTWINTDNLVVKNVTNMTSMFEGAKFNNISSSLSDKFRTNTGKVRSMSRMFAYNNDMASWTGNKFNTSNVEDFSGMFTSARFGMCDYSNGKRCVHDESKAYDSENCGSSNCSINVSNFDTSNAVKMDNMFADAREAHNINISGFDTASVTDMSYMFMSTINKKIDVSSFNTSRVSNMAGMFSGAMLTSLDISNFNTSGVYSMSRMFENLFGDRNTAQPLDLTGFDTSNVTDMSAMFSGSNITYLDLSSFDTSKVTNMQDMFFSLGEGTQMVTLSSFDTSNVTNMSWMFGNFTPEIADATCDESGDASAVIKKTANIYVPFSNTEIDKQHEGLLTKLGNFVESIFGVKDKKCDVSYNESEKALNIANFSREKGKFSNAVLDLRSFNTSKVTSMAGMFAGSKSNMVNITPSLDPAKDEGFNTKNVSDMSWMFAGISYSPIIKIPFDTSSVRNMTGMFAGLSTYSDDAGFDISSFKPTAGPEMGWLFTSSCIGKEVIVSKEMKEYLDSIPGNNKDDASEKGRFMYALISDTCNDIGRTANYFSGKGGLTVK